MSVSVYIYVGIGLVVDAKAFDKTETIIQHHRECCKKNEDHKFCPECGGKIKTERTTNVIRESDWHGQDGVCVRNQYDTSNYVIFAGCEFRESGNLMYVDNCNPLSIGMSQHEFAVNQINEWLDKNGLSSLKQESYPIVILPCVSC